MIPGNANPLLLASADEAAAAAVATKSLRFDSGDGSHLSRTPSSAGNRKTFTFSCWVKRSTSGTTDHLLQSGDNYFRFQSSDEIIFYTSGSTSVYVDAKFRDPSAWYSIILAVDTTQATAADRIKIYVNGDQKTLTAVGSLPSQNADLAINNNAVHYIGSEGSSASSSMLSGYLADVYFIDGSQLDATSFGAYDDNGVWQATAYSGTYGTNGFHLAFNDASSNAALGTDSSGNGNTFTVNNLIAAQFSPTATVVGDPASSTDNPFGSGNGHSVLFDGNDSIRFSGPGLITGDLTIECFLKIDSSGQSGYRRAFSTNEAVYSSEQSMIRRKNDGSFQFYFGDGTAEETDDTVDTATWHHAAISYDQSASAVSYYVDGTRVGTDTYSGTVKITEMVVAGGMTNENWIGNVSNCRITKQLLYTGTSLTVPTSTLTTTSQGATASNVVLLCCHKSSTTEVEGVFSAASETDSLFDVPTNGDQSDTGAGGEVSGNYCTWNPNQPTFATTSFSNGNLDSSIRFTNGSVTPYATGTIAVSSGKWFWEITLTQESSDTEYIGIIDGSHGSGAWSFSVIGAYFSDARKAVGGSPSSYGATYTTGDVIGVALDADNGNLEFYKNGVSQGSAATGMTFESYKPFTSANGTSTAQLVSANFGQRAFAYSAPSNYKALCTTNLPTPTVADGSDHFFPLASTGTFGGGTVTDSDADFTPSLVWVKRRNAAERHKLYNILSGTDGTRYKHLESDGNDAEGSGESGITAFVAGGYTSEGGGHINSDGQPFISWMWNCGTSTASNTDGSVTSSVRANQTAGISIVTYTNPSSGTFTVGHGLNAQVGMIITKHRNRAADWYVWHSAYTSEDDYINLNTTSAKGTATDFWGASPPGSSTFGGKIGTSALAGDTDLAIVFSAVEGFSSFGSYEGNGSSDGPFAYTGHKIAWLMLKDSSTTGAWLIWDIGRQNYNIQGPYLLADAPDAESDSDLVDFLSNGFKIRTTAGSMNTNGETYIWAAFAENPFSSNGGLAR